MQVSSLGFELQPKVDGITADIEELGDFTLLATIELDRLHHFAAKVVTVGFGHLDSGGNNSTIILSPNSHGRCYIQTGGR